MDIREKLVELLMQVEDNMCDDCGREPVGCAVVAIADHLLANGVTVQEWIPVTERLPDEGMPVLTLHDKYVQEYGNMMTAVRKNGNWYGCLGSTITHWMPLPSAPKGE